MRLLDKHCAVSTLDATVKSGTNFEVNCVKAYLAFTISHSEVTPHSVSMFHMHL